MLRGLICGMTVVLLFAGCRRAADSDGALESGEKIYRMRCAVCHLESGRGLPGNSPPLGGSPRVNGEPDKLLAVLLRGMRGPLVRDGVTYNGVMPSWKSELDSRQAAEVLTYIRQQWGNNAPPITWEYVTRVRSLVQAGAIFPSPEQIEALAPIGDSEHPTSK